MSRTKMLLGGVACGIGIALSDWWWAWGLVLAIALLTAIWDDFDD